jgi:hypothetical protein
MKENLDIIIMIRHPIFRVKFEDVAVIYTILQRVKHS